MTLRQKVSLCLILNALIILGEMVGGWWIGSVGLISDAALISLIKRVFF